MRMLPHFFRGGEVCVVYAPVDVPEDHELPFPVIDFIPDGLIPTGRAMGPDGTICIAQEFTGNILEIRPAAAE